jgi:NDP-sugar pyrophosphorylase family protein
MINAGAWLFEPSLLDELDDTRFNRVEEELFPALAGAGRDMYGFVHRGFWLDIGNPDVYLQANLALLSGEFTSPSARTEHAAPVVGARSPLGEAVLLGNGSTVASAARIERSICGADCRVEPNALVSASVLWEDP